ncbi:MAG: hypothetical protein FWC96_07335 [Oscillospiraceae bacterium]|nr:hypothetical protein [Oscillospiraceae bacterium]
MNIENNKFLFYVYVGLTASGYDGYDHSDADISALAGKIHTAGFSDRIKSWFARARTGQVEVNPYWPRGSQLSAASFFINGEYAFDVNTFFSFIENAGGVSDPIGVDDFRLWISELPGILQELDAHPATAALWDEYSRIVSTRASGWGGEIEKTIKAAEQFFGKDIPTLAFAPNLFTPYNADFVRIGSRIITVAQSPNAETMLHETAHTAIASYRTQFTGFAETYGLRNFADKSKMLKFGYMEDESAASIAHVIEECFVRAISTEISGGSDTRLQLHAEYGCTSVPVIARHVRRLKTTAATLPNLIDAVLNEMETKP